MDIRLIAAIIICLVSVRFEPASCDLNDPGYIQLDAHLNQNVASDDYDENMAEVIRLLQGFYDSPHRQVEEQDLYVALREVGAMNEFPELPSEHKCGFRTLGTLTPLAEKTNAHRHQLNPNSDSTRLEKMIHHMSLKRARECMPEYPVQYSVKHSTYVSNPNVRIIGGYTYAESFVDRSLDRVRRLRKLTRENFIEFLLDKDPLRRSDNGIAQHLMKGLKQTIELELDRDNLDFHTLYEVVLKQPCQLYYTHFGTSLFESVLFDEQMYPTKLGAYNQNDLYLVTFLKARATYLTCKALINTPQFKDRVEMAWNRAE